MKRKISIALIASILGTNMTPAISVFAEEVLEKQAIIVEETTNNESEDRVLTLSQRGNNYSEKNRTQTTYSMYAFDPTGYYVLPGETIKVYVDCDENGPMPKIVFGQIGDNKVGWSNFYTLKPGYNEITAPDFSQMSPAAIYFLSDSLPSEQAYAPKIRFEGGTKFPIYVHEKTDPDKFVEELRAYLKEVNYNDEEVVNGNGKYNICEITSENVIISTSAAGALVGVEQDLENGKDVSYYMDLWEELYDDFAKMSGYEMEDESDDNYRPRGKFNLRVFTKGSYAWAGGGYTGYNGGESEKRDNSFFSSLANSSTLTSGGWGIPHEVGHQFDSASIGTPEATNNLYSLMMQDKYLDKNRFETENIWENTFTAYHNTKNYPYYDDFLFCGAVYQLYAQFGDNVYGDAQKIARERRDELTGLNNKQRLAVTLSLATGYDLLYHFEYYNVEMNDKARSLVKDLKQLNKKTYYNNNKSINEEAKSFENSNVKPSVKVTDSNDTSVTLEINIEEDDDRLLLYEVYRDGKLLGVVYDKNTFIDKNVEKGVEYKYSVIAYDRKLNPSKESNVVVKNLNEPKITLNGDIVLKLKEEFNVKDFVQATDYNGNDISKDVKIVKGEIDNNKVGTYNLVLSVTHENRTTTKEVSVNVVSNYAYLSDLQEISSKVGWSVLKKDKSIENTTIKLLRNNSEVTYKKGLGAHANSEVVYNVEDLGFDYFESKIGVDQSMKNTAASVTFEVYVDNIKKYDSKTFKHNTNEESIKVDIKDAKEVKLVTTDNNDHNECDHSIWADAKFTTSNSKPKLQIPSSVSVVLGQDIDIDEKYSATDIEDGDLTKNVKISGEENVNFNKAGKYQVTYSVEDSDGNKVEKTRYIHVVSMDDFEYLTDFDYKSANQIYGTLKIDKSHSENKLRLTDENNEEVVYEKGLGTHATSTIIYDLTKLDKEYSRFTSYVGVDREAYNNYYSSVEFKVYVDNKLKYESGVMTSTQIQQFVYVDLVGAKELKLVVTDGNDVDWADHANWADAKLHFANEESLDLSEDVNIADKNLKEAIKKELELPGNTIKVGNILQLTSLTVSGVESLEGLQYAKNLQYLNIKNSEIKDLSPIKNLKKLTDIIVNDEQL